mgnify:CR=1 FL=1
MASATSLVLLLEVFRTGLGLGSFLGLGLGCALGLGSFLGLGLGLGCALGLGSFLGIASLLTGLGAGGGGRGRAAGAAGGATNAGSLMAAQYRSTVLRCDAANIMRHKHQQGVS